MPSRHTKQDAPSRASWALAGGAVSQGGPRRGLWTPVLGRPRAFASWQREMGEWEAPRRGRNQGEGVEPLRGEGGQAPVAGVEDGANDLAGWVVAGGGAARLDVYVYMYTCIYVYRPSWSGVEGGVAPCRAPPARYRYRSPPPNEVTDVKASLVVGGPRAPRRRCGGARPCPGGCTGGRRAEGRCLPGPSRPRGTIPLSL